jgi:hypothetical protein
MDDSDRLAARRWSGGRQASPCRFYPDSDGDAYPDPYCDAHPDSDGDAYPDPYCDAHPDSDGDALAATAAATSTIAHRDADAHASPSPAGNWRRCLGPLGLDRPGRGCSLDRVAGEAQDIRHRARFLTLRSRR